MKIVGVEKSVRQAIEERTCLEFVYQGHRRVVCPYVLGTVRASVHLLAYQRGGSTSNGAVSLGSLKNWRLFALSLMEDLRPSEDPWIRMPNYRRGGWGFEKVDICIPDFRSRRGMDETPLLELMLELSLIQGQLRVLAMRAGAGKMRDLLWSIADALELARTI